MFFRASQHFNELWGSQSEVELQGLLKQCPPAMASNLADLLFGRYLCMCPLFKGCAAAARECTDPAGIARLLVVWQTGSLRQLWVGSHCAAMGD